MSTGPMQVELTPAAGKALAGYLARELRRKPLAVTLAGPPAAPAPEQPLADDAAVDDHYSLVVRDTAGGGLEYAWLDATGRLRWVPADSAEPPASWQALFVSLSGPQ